VKYRDVGAALPFLVLVWFFLSPIAYSIQPSHSLLGILQGLNPLLGLVDATRWSLVGGEVSHLYLAAAVLESMVIFGIGLFYFSRVDRTIADDA
jgi:lipopolysaccharide transport system permease protein